MNVTQLQRHVELNRESLARSIETRNAAVKAEHARGATIYALAKQMRVSQGAVRKMLGM